MTTDPFCEFSYTTFSFGDPAETVAVIDEVQCFIDISPALYAVGIFLFLSVIFLFVWRK